MAFGGGEEFREDEVDFAFVEKFFPVFGSFKGSSFCGEGFGSLIFLVVAIGIGFVAPVRAEGTGDGPGPGCPARIVDDLGLEKVVAVLGESVDAVPALGSPGGCDPDPVGTALVVFGEDTAARKGAGVGTEMGAG